MKQEKNKGGRPRGFDRDGAIEIAMHLFWMHGYEGVSLTMLTEAVGIAPPSLYAAFGSKAGLYREALDRYLVTAEFTLSRGVERGLTLDEALSYLFNQAIERVTGEQGERGCMVSLGLLVCHPDHGELRNELAARRHAMAVSLDHDLRRWLPTARCGEAARFLCAVLQGIAVQAKDGATVQDLRATADIGRAAVMAMVAA
ncbi:TetR/AcrR family transcriptional regulator [Ochrobactrum sp. BTU1]|uniref:TetR/AcrR family transcriptional regulator n=1 Tax=Ochrobactrum sp. BTU1 TaxID=2840456 RepID=UPI001C03F5CA|nr:TetR/AcrR family transcriptional regulator [Ochrobactrum sp. BTU1]